MQQGAATGSRSVVLVVDAQQLRGAGFVGLLGGWAVANGVRLRAARPEEADRAATPDALALLLLCVGGASLREPPAAQWLHALLARGAGAPLAVVADRDEPEEVVAALTAGARGFLPTSTSPEVALHALSYILGGGSFFPPGALLRRLRPKPPRGPEPDQGGAAPGLARGRLAAPDLAVLVHLRAGRSNKAIAQLLGVQEAAVKAQLRRIMRRLGVANRTQAALLAHALPVAPAANDDPPPRHAS